MIGTEAIEGICYTSAAKWLIIFSKRAEFFALNFLIDFEWADPSGLGTTRPDRGSRAGLFRCSSAI